MRTEAELEAHTSAGLIRRAKKALTISQPAISAVNSDAIEYEFEGFKGRVNLQQFLQSQCDCPASGVCKHLVAVVLHHMANANEQVATVYEAPDFTATQLLKVRNKQGWRKAYAQVSGLFYSDGFSVAKEVDHCIVSWGHYSAIIGSSNDIEDIVVEGHSGIAEKLMAALLLQRWKGDEIHWPDWLIEEFETAEYQQQQDRLTVKQQVKSCLEKLTDIGVNQLQSANLYELNSVIPRLKSLGLSGIGNGLNALNERVTLRETGVGIDHDLAILFLLGQIFASCESPVNIDRRSQTFEGTNKFICLGGHQWQTDSNVHGLSMVLLSEQGELFSAAVARPIKTPGFSPVQAWRAQQLWEGAPLNQNLPGTHFELDTVELNQWGSLVLKRESSFCPLESDAFSLLPTIQWENLKEIEEYGYALLEPKRWVSCEFNERLQELQLVVEDQNGRMLLIRQAFRTSLELRISNISELWVNSPKYIVVRHRLQSGEHIFEPVIMFTNKWVSPDFAQVNKQKLGVLQRLVLKWQKKHSDRQQRPLKGLDLQLHKLREQMCLHPSSDAEELAQICAALEQLGLEGLSAKAKAMASSAETFLQLSYLITQLARHNAKWPIFETLGDFQ